MLFYDFFSMAEQPLVGRGPLVIETSRSHSDTPHAVELLWTSDQPYGRPLNDKTQTHKTQTSMPRRNSNPKSEKARGRRSTP